MAQLGTKNTWSGRIRTLDSVCMSYLSSVRNIEEKKEIFNISDSHYHMLTSKQSSDLKVKNTHGECQNGDRTGEKGRRYYDLHFLQMQS